MIANINVVFPDWRGTVSRTSRYTSRPESGCVSKATSTTCCCHGINGVPSCSAIAATSRPRVGRSVLAVDHLGRQPGKEDVKLIYITTRLRQLRQRRPQLPADRSRRHPSTRIQLIRQRQRQLRQRIRRRIRIETLEGCADRTTIARWRRLHRTLPRRRLPHRFLGGHPPTLRPGIDLEPPAAPQRLQDDRFGNAKNSPSC